MSEAAIMSDGNVTITKTLAVVNGVSYPTNTISAISVRKIPLSYAWLIWSIILGVVALGAVADHYYVAALICVGIVVLLVALRPKQTYSLMVRSAGADTSVLASRDLSYLGNVKGAIEEAVRQRG